MISCAAAKQMRCVKPSMTTVSPSCTKRATASRIDMTLPGVGSGEWGVGPDCTAPLPTPHSRPAHASRHLRQALADDPQRRVHVVLVDRERGCEAEGAPAAAEQEEAAVEG